MKNQRRFKAPNYSRDCSLAKAFGVSAAYFSASCHSERSEESQIISSRRACVPNSQRGFTSLSMTGRPDGR